ncbi:MAG TPA: DNA replication/repair protein RecF [Geminicoccus sp.]|uniref:DNA replication/repair protein RecF n=1 Tax=Geminicoccus sp. TaxID=2024832 RepID=UPI002E37C295|nr:DNA replication/repair protein RecF [Geminicoccus sp.]HEX2529206.1 DNA replication/repair protein RecF [Geminicoccus sp.]
MRTDDVPDALPCVVRRLQLSCFRNLSDHVLNLPDGPVVLHGDNGAGKTNLLEAVSMLAPGRGLRRARASEQACTGGTGGWALQGHIEGPEGIHAVATGLEPGQERRRFRLDGRDIAARDELPAVVGVVWLTPAEDRLFVEAPAERRRFLDRLIGADDPAFAGLTARYDRRLRERTAVLRGERPDRVWVSTLEAALAADAVAIAAARAERVESLDAMVADSRGPFPRVRLEVSGELEALMDGRPALDVEEEVAARLQRSRDLDRDAGGALIGPHRSDLIAIDAETATPAARCSTGRQKALLLSIVLGELARRRRIGALVPILLLDEAAAHLDGTRRAALFERILDAPGQTWLSGTEQAPFAALRGKAAFFHLNQGDIADHV